MKSKDNLRLEILGFFLLNTGPEYGAIGQSKTPFCHLTGLMINNALLSKKNTIQMDDRV